MNKGGTQKTWPKNKAIDDYAQGFKECVKKAIKKLITTTSNGNGSIKANRN